MIEYFENNKEELVGILQEKDDLLERMDEEIAYLKQENAWLRQEILLDKNRLYGPSSEKASGQTALLFNEAEVTTDPKEPEPTVEDVVEPARKKTKGKREAQLKDLPQVDEHHEIPEAERICPQCTGHMNDIGVETRRQIVTVPAQFYVLNRHQHKYACPHCQKNDVSTPVIQAEVPKPPIPGSIASPALLAFIAERKYDQAMPLYRQEVSMEREGIEISRQTMANWMILSGGILTPVYDLLHKTLLKQDIIRADETTLQVLHEPGREPQTKSYIWHYGCHIDGISISLFEYQATRSADHPKEFLKWFSGFLQVDGYIAYELLIAPILVGCWAHARRKFDEAVKTLPVSIRKKNNSLAHMGLAFCNKLYHIEHELKGQPGEVILKVRRDKSKMVLDEFRTWLETQQPQVAPKSALGKAITYCLNQWHKLIHYLLDPRLEIDNNRAERSVKPYVVGRKNWLFATSSKGAWASATIYSIVETAKENGLHPRKYLEYLFTKLPNRNKGDSLEDLLPWAAEPQAICRPAIIDT